MKGRWNGHYNHMPKTEFIISTIKDINCNILDWVQLRKQSSVKQWFSKPLP